MISYYREMPVLFKEFYQIYALRLSKKKLWIELANFNIEFNWSFV